MDAAVLGFLVLALLVGGVIGWLLGGRDGAGARQTVENLRLQLDEVVKERDANRGAVSELAALKATQDEREKSFQQQIEALKEAKESLSAQFHEIANKLLGDHRKSFLEQAGEKFTQAVSPVETLLKTYQEKLQTIEKERVDHYAGLREAVELVRTGQGQVRDETRHLVNALRASPKARPSAQALVDQIGWLAERGVTEVRLAEPALESLEAYLDWLRWTAEEVVPKAIGL